MSDANSGHQRSRAAATAFYAKLEENDVDLKKLQGWLEKIQKLDFYGATLRAEAGTRRIACEACSRPTPSACSTRSTRTAEEVQVNQEAKAVP